MQPTPKPRSPNRRLLVLVAVLIALAVVVTVVVLVTRGKQSTPSGSGPSAAPTSRPSATGPQPVPNPSPSVPTFPLSGKPTQQELVLLDKRVGFGGRVTGGAGGSLVHVSTNADSGPGSLRDALSGDSPRWIVFKKDMTITLTKALEVGSNKTIDARGHKIEITAPKLDGLDIINSSNVIIESLTMHDFGDVTQTKNNNPNDAIHLDNAKGVWIDHDDLSMAGDKLIAVSNGSSGITVTWNHFRDQEQTFQIGNQATGAADTRQTVTVADNFFDRTGYRDPVVSYGRAHVYNNYYYEWKLYAVRSERAAQVYLQNNVFQAGTKRLALRVKPGGDGCNDARTRCDNRPGSLKITGNLLLSGAKINKTDSSGTVFTPGDLYRYTAKPATLALAKTIQNDSGPQ